MRHAESSIALGHALADKPDAVRSTIQYAHKATSEQAHKEDKPIPGSCTVCVATVRPKGVLQVGNLGDSGIRVFREGHCVYASEVSRWGQHAS